MDTGSHARARLDVHEELIAGPEAEIGPGYSKQADGYAAMERLLALPRPPTADLRAQRFHRHGGHERGARPRHFRAAGDRHRRLR